MTKSNFYNRSQMVARWATSIATICWGMLIIALDGALDHMPMLDYLQEKTWGALAVGMGLLQVARTARASAPCLFGHVCNFSMCVLWTWVAMRIASFQDTTMVAFALPPAAVMCCLSWINFGAIPKVDLKEERRQWTSFFRG